MHSSTFQLVSLDDIDARLQAEANRYNLHPSNPDHPSMVAVDEHGYVDVYWGGYEYSIPLVDIKTPADVLWRIHHLAKKRWSHMTPARIAKFIATVAGCNQWSPYGAMPHHEGPSVRTTSDAAERARLTPKLRYDVLRRDNFQCRACGASPETGAHLHIDHITAIANGGLTEFRNLQALCSQCNYGKGASK